MVGKEEHGTFRFCGKEFHDMKTLALTSQPKTTLIEYNQSLMT